MIITILPSSANFHAIAYNEMKVEKGLATLLEVQNIDAFALKPIPLTSFNGISSNTQPGTRISRNHSFMSQSVA